jgi:glycosyltransferase involved in cell wall biosynthesis
MHVVHLMASPFVGGPERQVLGLARHLPPAVRTSFLSFSERGLARPFLEEARRAGYTALELRYNTPRFTACIAEVAGALRDAQADVLCCSGYKPDLIGWRAARRVRIPVVSISHGWTAATLRVRLYEAVDRMALHWMDAVVCVSAAQAAKVRRALVPRRKIRVIPNAIAAEAFAPADPAFRTALLAFFPMPPRYVVGAAGRMSPEKNLALFVDAAARVATEHGDVGFVIFGDGPLRSALIAQIARLGLGDRCKLVGFRTDLGRFLPNFDVLVLSSTTEGLPVILLEACAASVPVVATAVGGIPEVLEEGRGGYLVPSGDAPALAARIVDVLRDDATRRAMGRDAQERVRRHFSFAQQAQQYEVLFGALTAKS